MFLLWHISSCREPGHSLEHFYPLPDIVPENTSIGKFVWGNLFQRIHSVLKIFLQKPLGRVSSSFFWHMLLLLGCTLSQFLSENRHKYREREKYKYRIKISIFFWQLMLLLGLTLPHFLRENRHKYREREIQIQKKNNPLLLLAADAPARPYSLTLSQRKQTQIHRERNTNTEEE